MWTKNAAAVGYGMAWYGMRCKRWTAEDTVDTWVQRQGAAVGEKVSRQSRLLVKQAVVTGHYSH